MAQVKDLLGSDNDDASARWEDPSSVSSSDAERDMTTLDETFWATLVGDDRRLAELRRAVDEAAAEAMALETKVDKSPRSNSELGESRWEAANRKINEALKAERP